VAKKIKTRKSKTKKERTHIPKKAFTRTGESVKYAANKLEIKSIKEEG